MRIDRSAMWMVTLLAAVVVAGHVLAQADQAGPANEANEPDASSEPVAAEPQVDPGEDAATGEDATDATDARMRELMERRETPPTVPPTRGPDAAPTMRVELDRSVLGLAPDQDPPALRREGEFIVNRRGRLRQSPDGMHVLFVFHADDRDSPEPPMVLQPCRLLETMENVVHQRGHQVTFILSGQVHAYRGANYLLPTSMRIDVERQE